MNPRDLADMVRHVIRDERGYTRQRRQERLDDMRPFVRALLTPLMAVQLPIMTDLMATEGKSVSRPCPFCPDVSVAIERQERGYQLRHPRPYCPAFARYLEAE